VVYIHEDLSPKNREGLDLLAAFSVGNRVDDPSEKGGSSSPVVACKTMRRCWREVRMRRGSEGLAVG